jgi:NAD(P)H dehydrogenase (quinone)
VVQGRPAAVVLASAGTFDRPTPPLTGPQAVDLAELAVMAWEITGRPIRREVITSEAMRAKLAAFGLPEPAVNISMNLYAAARQGEFAAVDPTPQKLLGRPPRSARNFLSGMLAA